MQGARSESSWSSSSSRGPDSPAAGREASGHGLERFLPLAQVTRAAPRVVKIKRKKVLKRRNTLGSRCENFVPWVPNHPDDPQDLEEEERMERTAGLFDRYAARKRKRQVSSSGESDATPVQYADLSQPTSKDQSAADGSSGDRVITIPGSPELGQTVGPRLDQSESNEDNPAPRALQIIPPSDQREGSQNISEFMRSGLPRPKWPDQVIINNYIPPRRPEPPRVEISAPGEEEVKKKLCRWEPFHRGEPAANRLNDLYPTAVVRNMALQHHDF